MKKYITLTIALLSMALISLRCSNQMAEPKDWSETVKLYVAAETGEYKYFEGSMEGMKIKEDTGNEWRVVHFQSIDGFSYEKGHSYTLKVEKTHLGNPPADGSNIRYRLLEVLSKQ